MNAQEAIERIERYRNCNEEYNGEVHEALSILLESARLLHELLKSVHVEVPSERASHLPDIELDSQGYSNDFYIVLSEKAYKSIGIEGGADE